MSDTDEPYNNGGFIEGAAAVQVTLEPDECIIAIRNGTYVCTREHDHGSTHVIDAMNSDPDVLDTMNRALSGGSSE